MILSWKFWIAFFWVHYLIPDAHGLLIVDAAAFSSFNSESFNSWFRCPFKLIFPCLFCWVNNALQQHLEHCFSNLPFSVLAVLDFSSARRVVILVPWKILVELNYHLLCNSVDFSPPYTEASILFTFDSPKYCRFFLGLQLLCWVSLLCFIYQCFCFICFTSILVCVLIGVWFRCMTASWHKCFKWLSWFGDGRHLNLWV